MNTSIQAHESHEEYINRIIQNREVLELSWIEVVSLIKTTIGYSPAVRTLQTRLAKLRDDAIINKALELSATEEDIEERKSSLQEYITNSKIQKYQLAEERTQTAAYVRALSRETSILDIAKHAVERMEHFQPMKFEYNKVQEFNGNTGILMISDWHYGMEIKNSMNTFNPTVCRERVNDLAGQVIRKGRFHKINTLQVVNLSDLIAGRIHLPLRLQTRIDVITQIIEVSEIVAEFVAELAKHFNIEYYDCLDNHSRIEPNKNNSLDLESLTRIIPWFLKDRLRDNERVTVHNNEFSEDIIVFNCNGFKVGGVHGHDDNPSTVVSSLTMFTKFDFDLILTAHFHHFQGEEVNCVVQLANGSLMGTDDHAFKKRKSAKPSQTLIIATEDNVLDTICRLVLK